MSAELTAPAAPTGRSKLKSIFWGSVYVAPWVVFGPITGVMTGWALRCFRSGRPALGVLWLIANVAAVASIPILTAVLARRL